MNVVRLSLREFLDLPDYSCSLPTGTTIGKRWRRREPYECTARDRQLDRLGTPAPGVVWYLGGYVDCDEEGKVGIEWSIIYVMTAREAQAAAAVAER